MRVAAVLIGVVALMGCAGISVGVDPSGPSFSVKVTGEACVPQGGLAENLLDMVGKFGGEFVLNRFGCKSE